MAHHIEVGVRSFPRLGTSSHAKGDVPTFTTPLLLTVDTRAIGRGTTALIRKRYALFSSTGSKLIVGEASNGPACRCGARHPGFGLSPATNGTLLLRRTK